MGAMIQAMWNHCLMMIMLKMSNHGKPDDNQQRQWPNGVQRIR